MARMTRISTAVLGAVSGGIALGLSGCGEETYDLRGPALREGERVRQEYYINMENGNVTLEVANESVRAAMGLTFWRAAEFEVLELNNDVPSRMRIDVEYDVDQFSMTIMGHEETETKRSPLEGRKLLAAQQGDNWSVSLESGQSSGSGDDDHDEIEQHLDAFAQGLSDGLPFTTEAFPSEPVKVGYEWDATGAALSSLIGGGLTDTTGNASLTFVRITKVDGHECAEISAEVDVSGSMTLDDDQMQFAMTMNGTIYRSLETHADIDTSWTGTMRMSGSVVEEGMLMNLTVNGPVSVTRTERRIR